MRFLWLDDVRPAPKNWVHCKNVVEARRFFLECVSDCIELEMSLDHDLGICERCTPGEIINNIVVTLESVCDTRTCNCYCHETGYDFVKWLAGLTKYDISFIKNIKVHSANPVGAANMKSVIERYLK